MFDAYHVRAVTERVTEQVNVEVTEKRAPTDESVKLLREMEAAARAAIVATIRVDDSPIKAVLHMQKDAANDEYRFAIVYMLNGQKIDIRHTVNPFPSIHDPLAQGGSEEFRERCITELRDCLAKDIANRLTEGMTRAFNEKAGKFGERL